MDHESFCTGKKGWIFVETPRARTKRKKFEDFLAKKRDRKFHANEPEPILKCFFGNFCLQTEFCLWTQSKRQFQTAKSWFLLLTQAQISIWALTSNFNNFKKNLSNKTLICDQITKVTKLCLKVNFEFEFCNAYFDHILIFFFTKNINFSTKNFCYKMQLLMKRFYLLASK